MRTTTNSLGGESSNGNRCVATPQLVLTQSSFTNRFFHPQHIHPSVFFYPINRFLSLPY
uniref:Uncharacterized protein n=1 Tax=Rhizophagus irregularis (strain DAOM 181602 / DAOM 197198 / MUCL 43194) TaxID=747089 RepID=U9TGH0_RHIID